jgi:outer membrane cobalamin receptor
LVGERSADQQNVIKIDSFNKLMIGADYKINNDFSVFLKFDNLLNSNVYIWNTYKERGLFASAGVMWQF